ncbi:hypothetical protein PSA01_08400 [Pseudonocardia saturnea]|uniref:Uncharacterized protein n=1 Tax=Pseudonocardia saturnea TaxID=33909 RepID=A0ABQ0RT14_9PSEU|nr:hypothetical protein PSA01_08400 [Pseudonocardia saturnea]
MATVSLMVGDPFSVEDVRPAAPGGLRTGPFQGALNRSGTATSGDPGHPTTRIGARIGAVSCG